MSAPPPSWQPPPEPTPFSGYGAPPPAPPGQPGRTAERRTGLPVWVALVLVVAIGALVLLLEPVFIKKTGSTAQAALHAGRLPSSAVSTATRPPTAERTYSDPLPTGVRPGWTVHDLSTDRNTSPPSYSGSWRPVSNSQYAAWIQHLTATGWKHTPGKRNDASNYDLVKGHARLLGSFHNFGGPGSATFGYDPNA